MRKESVNRKNSCVFEGMTSISAVLDSIENGGRRIERVLYDETKEESKRKELSFLFAMGRKYSFEVTAVSPETIDGIALGNTHGGIIAECTERVLPKLSEDCRFDGKFWVLIEGIEDPYNFGYAIRSLYAAGADGIVLPGRNWMSAAGVVCRSSAGTSEKIEMIEADDTLEAVRIFRERGYKIVCAGIRDSVPVFDANLTLPLLLVAGGEKRGISRAVLDSADVTVRIEYGRKFNGSLSTASAVTVLGFEVQRQNRS